MSAPLPRSEPIRMSSPIDAVCAVPHLVGFHPTSSLVVICLYDPRGQVGLTMRFDLPVECDEEAFAEEVLIRVEHAEATAILLVAYPDVDSPPVSLGRLPRAALVEDIERRCLVSDIRVTDALCVVDGRFWSYLCSDPRCCPPDGTEVPDRGTGPVAHLAAVDVARGRAVLADRAALQRSVAPVTFLARQRMGQALATADAQRETRDPRGAAGAVAELVERYADPRTATMSDEEAARVIVALIDVESRDAVLADAAAAGDLDEHLAVFLELARRALPPYDAPTLTVLAWIAYVRGNGALANVALDRVRASDPSYHLAWLIVSALSSQIPPDAIRAAMRTP